MTSSSFLQRYDVIQSYESRGQALQESDESVTLGQKNADGKSTRSKITHIELAGLGIIGTVLSVAYGKWGDLPATCISLKFDFRCKDGIFKFEQSEIQISFNPDPRYGKPVKPTDRGEPAILCFYPRKHNKQQASSPRDTEPSFILESRIWSKRKRDLAHQVFWKINENKQAKSGIPGQLFLCAVVASNKPFQAVVKARAKLALGVTLENLPWSEDDPLLFDGSTAKGPQMESDDFGALEESYWEQWLAKFEKQTSFSPSLSSVYSLVNTLQEAKTEPPKFAYRVRAIPVSWSEEDTIRNLAILFQMQHRVNEISLMSFTRSAFPSREEKCAVVSFLDHLPHSLEGQEQEWTFSLPQESDSGRGLQTIMLAIDRTFEGFTSLGKIEINHDTLIRADIIVVPGLGGHAYGSFKQKGGSYMWLQDSLAQDIQLTHCTRSNEAVRILTYGYESHIAGSQSFQTLRELGTRLQTLIREIRAKAQINRPIIFIAHSLGGLVVKEAIIRMSLGGQQDQNNLKCIAGALFFGVPNKGMDITSLVPMAGNQPNRRLLNSIRKDSILLQEQHKAFEEAFPFLDSKIISVYETRLSPTAIERGSKWSMEGPSTVLVDRESATQGRSGENANDLVLGLDRDHSGLVKFGYKSDDYEVILGYLRDVLQNAPQVLSLRFQDALGQTE